MRVRGYDRGYDQDVLARPAAAPSSARSEASGHSAYSAYSAYSGYSGYGDSNASSSAKSEVRELARSHGVGAGRQRPADRTIAQKAFLRRFQR